MRISLKSGLLACVFAAAAVALPASADPAPAYKLVKAVPLGAPDRWDYVVYDAGTNRVYVAHSDQLAVVDARDGTLVGSVQGIAGGTHGTGISVATGKGYTDDGRNGQAVAFDLKSLAVTARVPVDPDADGVTFDPKSGHVFFIEGDSEKVAVVDPKTDSVLAKIAAGGKLEYGAADGRGHVFVNGEEKKDIVVIDTATNTVTAHWPIPDCESPHGMAIDTKSHRVFASCVNEKMMVVNTDNGKVVAEVPIGKGSDAAGFDPSHKRVFSSNGRDGTLSVIQENTPDSYTPLATVTTQVSGRTMDVDPKTGRVFIAAAELGTELGPNGRPKAKPGSLKLLFLDPVN
jgi:DNA-binding beta-propeller fold protein YncE